MIRIITDSSSDISLEHAKELNIDLLSLSVSFGEETFKSLTEISNAEFYERLATVEKLPTTSQVTPGEFEDLFRKYTEQGDDVICLLISSKMSGTHQSAVIAKESVGADNIYIVETMTVTMGLALLVEEAVKLRDKGFTASEIAKEIEEMASRNHLYAIVADLKYLKMGGRLSSTSAFFASILGIVPIITIKDGLVEVAGKARGKQAAFKVIEQLIEKNQVSSDHSIVLGHTNSLENLGLFKEFFASLLKKRVIYTCELGSIVGTHVGAGACGLAYIKK